jgi:drug/metabolite transporter (DMT)-like permease
MHNVAPLIVIGVTAVVVRRRPAALCLLGIAFAIVGPALLFADSARFSLDRFGGDLIGLAAAIFYAAYFIVIGRHPSPKPAAERMINVSIGAALVLVPAALWLEPQFFPHDIGGWWTLFGVAMFAQAVGQVLLAGAIGKLRPFGVAAVAPLEPVGTTLLAAMLLAQPVSALQFAGLTAAIVGVVLCQASRDARPRARLPTLPGLPALPTLAIRGGLRRRLQPVAAPGRRGQPGSVPAIARS